MDALDEVERWPAETVAVAVADSEAVIATRGPGARLFAWASVTKLLTASAVLVAAEEGILDFDEPAGPPGSTVRHLLAHASGLPPEGTSPVAHPGARRIYSNSGYEALGALVAKRAEMPFHDYLAGSVLEPVGMDGTRLDGSPASAAAGPLDDLVAFGRELLAPRFLARETLAEATRVAFPGLVGILPGLGRQEHNDWGLGFELRDEKDPHWTGTRNSPRTFGHFGRSGTFLWVDPDARLACACLTDHEFGDWAKHAWPRLADALLDELRRP
ncbi:MAG TPA: serine hydrolase domain-containing protein [Gaiellaceae bacterium]|nr:serine hydrolase domain-containing protein [Gaiellaceae bacterium]